MIEPLVALAHTEFRKFHANRAFSDWASAFHAERVAEILLQFEKAVVRADACQSWKDGWAALDQMCLKLGEIRDEYDKQRNADEVRTFMAELEEQGALFSETSVRVLPK